MAPAHFILVFKNSFTSFRSRRWHLWWASINSWAWGCTSCWRQREIRTLSFERVHPVMLLYGSVNWPGAQVQTRQSGSCFLRQVFAIHWLPLWSTWSLHVYFSCLWLLLSLGFLAVNFTVEGPTPSVITCQHQRTSLLTHFGATLSLPKVNHLLQMHQEFLLMILQCSSMRFDKCDPGSPPPPSSRPNIFPP